MSKYVIISDTGCDLDQTLRARFGVEECLHGILYFPDGRETTADLDWSAFTPEWYYGSMKGRKSALYRTASPTLGETEEVFEKYLAAGCDILSISMSSALSCTYNNCVAVGEELMKKYPGRKVICVDSLRYSTSLALLIALAHKRAEAGVDIEEVAEYLNEVRHCIHQMGPMDDLSFLAKMNRVSNAKAFFGTLAGVNPMADFNREGLSEVLGKFKGKNAALDATLKYMEKTGVDLKDQIIFVAHSNREEAAKRLAAMINEKFAPKEIIINPVGMACGANIGPGLCAAFYLGAPISAGNERERKIMNEIMTGKSEDTAADNTEGTITHKDYAIVGDSTCDLTSELRKKYSIEYVKMNYVVEGSEYPASLDWESHTAQEFYGLMRNGKRVTTTQVPRGVFESEFKKHLQAGRDILYIGCSSALSGSVNLARTIAEELIEEYPERNIICIDALNSSLGQGMMLIKAAMLREEGVSIEENAAYIEENKLRVNQCGTVASLEYLRKAGRVKASSAFFGNLFGVKPIIISDAIGQNYAIKKVKGAINARKEIARMIAEEAIEPEHHQLCITHADCEAEALALRDEILALKPFAGVTLNYIGPIVGASVGPGTVIAYCYGEKVTVEGKE